MDEPNAVYAAVTLPCLHTFRTAARFLLSLCHAWLVEFTDVEPVAKVASGLLPHAF